MTDNKSLYLCSILLSNHDVAGRARSSRKASRRNFSRALARKTILIVMKLATDVTYRYSWSPMCKRPTSFQASIFLRDNGSYGKKCCPSWLVSERREGGSPEVEWARPRCTRREIMAKGTWRGVGIFSRRYYRPRALTVRAIESLFHPASRSLGDDNTELAHNRDYPSARNDTSGLSIFGRKIAETKLLMIRAKRDAIPWKPKKFPNSSWSIRIVKHLK